MGVLQRLKDFRDRRRQEPPKPLSIEKPWSPAPIIDDSVEWIPRNRGERRMVQHDRKRTNRRRARVRGQKQHAYRQARWQRRLLRELEKMDK